MSHREQFVMGPGRGRRRRRLPSKPVTATPSPVLYSYEPLPTEYRLTAHGVLLVANPNKCLICHKLRHGDTPHHAFEPELATLDAARSLGWPLPPNQEQLPS